MFSKVINEETKEVQVGFGDNKEYFESLGMTEQDVKQAWDGNWYLTGFAPVKPVPTDDEISVIRAQLYASDSDAVFNSYQQGVASLQDYIDAKAQISFDNKKSTQTAMTLDDFKHKVSREYELFKQSGKVIKNTTYDYKESSGTSDLVVSDADISLIRPTTGVNVILPAITKTQIVKIDNVSGDTVNISSINSEFIEGVNSPYILQSKGIIEFIADVSKKSWDVYTAPLEIEDGINIEVEVNPSANRNNATNIKFGKGFTGYTDPDKNGVILEVQDNDNRPPSLYASLAVPEEVVGRGSSAIHRGVIWFDNVISAIRTNVMDLRKAEKSYGIQEYDNKDPNVTGGQPYLVIFRPSLKVKHLLMGLFKLLCLIRQLVYPLLILMASRYQSTKHIIKAIS